MANVVVENQTQTDVLSAEARAFLTKLGARFEGRRQELLARRRDVQKKLDGDWRPDFLPETAAVRSGDWTVAPIPEGSDGPARGDHRPGGPQDGHQRAELRRERLHGGFRGLEFAHLAEQYRRARSICATRSTATIEFTSPEGKKYELSAKTATLLVRPRGWHLDEKHFLVDGEPISGSLFDFGLYFFHNAKALMAKGTGPYFYLPKMESHLEARLWNDVFQFRAGRAGRAARDHSRDRADRNHSRRVRDGRDSVELREHSAGLNCGRWDYIFSFIKKFRKRPDFVLPNRALVTMERHFLKSYVRAADPDLPPARHSRHGRHGGADSDQERSGGERSGAGKSAAGQAARSAGRARRHLGGASGPGADREGNLRRVHAEPNQISRSARTCT